MPLEPKSLVQNLPALRSLPEVIREIERTIESPDSSLDSIDEILLKDTDLTSRLLRLANSAFYGFPSAVETAAQALSLIGLSQLKQLLTASAFIDYFQNLPSAEVSMRVFWKHSIACGIAARTLAIQRRSAIPDRFFVLGLIHAVGRLLVFLRAPDEASGVFQTYQKGEAPYLEIEKRLLGYEYADYGAELLRSWMFPTSMVESIRNHTKISSVVENRDAALLHLADVIVHSMQLGNDGEQAIPVISPYALIQSGLHEKSIRFTYYEVERQYDETVKLFLGRKFED